MCVSEKRKTRIIALCGKGGVGKTSIAAAVTKILTGNPRARVLAIDADPAVGLASALDISVRCTVDGRAQPADKENRETRGRR